MNNIKAEADRQNISVAELARRSGVAYGTVYGVYTGKTEAEKMDVRKFIRIAGALGMSADELYTGKRASRRRDVKLDPREEGLLESFRRCDESGKQAIEAAATAISARFDKDRHVDFIEPKALKGRRKGTGK